MKPSAHRRMFFLHRSKRHDLMFRIALVGLSLPMSSSPIVNLLKANAVFVWEPLKPFPVHSLTVPITLRLDISINHKQPAGK